VTAAGGRTKPGRSPLAAAVLTGIAPGAGHLYAGRAGRGAVLVALLGLTCVAWTTQAARSFTAAKAFAFPPMILVLGMIADSVRVARAAPRPFPLGRWHRWWAYASVIALTGFLAPTALAWSLGTRAGTVHPGDDSMEPWLRATDTLVYDPRAYARNDPRRGDVIVVRAGRGDGTRAVRRIVGVPGETVALRHGAVVVGGMPWIEDARRAALAGRLSIPPTSVEPGRLLVLPDRRAPGDHAGWDVARRDVAGRVSYVLLPGDMAPERLGEPVR
jgi:signal peptidase I